MACMWTVCKLTRLSATMRHATLPVTLVGVTQCGSNPRPVGRVEGIGNKSEHVSSLSTSPYSRAILTYSLTDLCNQRRHDRSHNTHHQAHHPQNTITTDKYHCFTTFHNTSPLHHPQTPPPPHSSTLPRLTRHLQVLLRPHQPALHRPPAALSVSPALSAAVRAAV